MSEDLLPKKKTTSTASSKKKTGSKVSPEMLRLIRVNRGIGILIGGFITLVGTMSVIGAITDNFWVRFGIGIVLVIGIPAFVADRFLKRAEMSGGLSLVADVFAILLLAIALVFVSLDVVTRPMFSREGDRYARSGSRTMARLVYWVGGVSPVFPGEAGSDAKATGSASASAAPSADGGKP